MLPSDNMDFNFHLGCIITILRDCDQVLDIGDWEYLMNRHRTSRAHTIQKLSDGRILKVVWHLFGIKWSPVIKFQFKLKLAIQ